MWTLDLVEEMHKEWQRRYKHTKIHKSYIVAQYLRENPPPFENLEMTPFALAMPVEFKSDDAIWSYREYYKTKTFGKWRNGKPYWL
jgi:hypothetical protein